jgi:hypothetical protein
MCRLSSGWIYFAASPTKDWRRSSKSASRIFLEAKFMEGKHLVLDGGQVEKAPGEIPQRRPAPGAERLLDALEILIPRLDPQVPHLGLHPVGQEQNDVLLLAARDGPSEDGDDLVAGEPEVEKSLQVVVQDHMPFSFWRGCRLTGM